MTTRMTADVREWLSLAPARLLPAPRRGDVVERGVGAALLALRALLQRDLPLAGVDLFLQERAVMGGRLEVGHAGEKAFVRDGLLQDGEGESLRGDRDVIDAGGGHQ